MPWPVHSYISPHKLFNSNKSREVLIIILEWTRIYLMKSEQDLWNLFIAYFPFSFSLFSHFIFITSDACHFANTVLLNIINNLMFDNCKKLIDMCNKNKSFLLS